MKLIGLVDLVWKGLHAKLRNRIISSQRFRFVHGGQSYTCINPCDKLQLLGNISLNSCMQLIVLVGLLWKGLPREAEESRNLIPKLPNVHGQFDN